MKTTFLIAILGISLNAMAQQDPNVRTRELKTAKEELLINMDKMPYNRQEHAAIKKYFVELQSLTNDLNLYRKYLRRFTTHLKDMGTEKFCDEAMLSRSNWSQLMINCTKNSFFLCSEEVKTYPKLMEELKGLLGKDSQIDGELAGLCD